MSIQGTALAEREWPPPAAVRRRWIARPRGRRLALTIGAALLLLMALVAIGLRHHAGGSPLTLGLIAAVPYLLLAAPVALVLLVLARQWIGVAVAVPVLLLAGSTQLWLYTSDDAPANAVRLHVLTANLRLGEADPAAVVNAVRRHHVDVLMVEELTDSEQDGLEHAGLDALLPHHASKPSPTGGYGTGLWSRYPMSAVHLVDEFTFALVTARLAVPGVARPVQAVALHASGPLPDPTPWQADITRLPGFLDRLPKNGPVVVGGDFNATPDTLQFRRVLDTGYADAADQSGAGYTRTFPANEWYPPLIAIDHVLSRGGPVATDVRTISVRGSDHRAVLATLAVPRSPH